MSNLKDKNIIVTGASGGIGNSIVRKLYESGANILASGTKLEKLEKLKSENKNIKILKFDISEIEKIDHDKQYREEMEINFSKIRAELKSGASTNLAILVEEILSGDSSWTIS